MQIKQILKILAETRDMQVAYLEELGTSPSTDELALQFDDSFQVFKDDLEDKFGNSVLIEKVLKNLDTINSIFDKMSDISDNSFWDISSLNNEEWVNVRKIAEDTISLISNLET